MSGISDFFYHFTASGIIDATWTLVWHWGLAVGLIVLCLGGAYLTRSPYFIVAAFLVFVGMILYADGQRDQGRLDTAKTKLVYLKAHPTLRVTAKKWTVAPNWYPGRPTPPPETKPVCGELEWGCTP